MKVKLFRDYRSLCGLAFLINLFNFAVIEETLYTFMPSFLLHITRLLAIFGIAQYLPVVRTRKLSTANESVDLNSSFSCDDFRLSYAIY